MELLQWDPDMLSFTVIGIDFTLVLHVVAIYSFSRLFGCGRVVELACLSLTESIDKFSITMRKQVHLCVCAVV